jgi:hypothetical protein
MDTTPDTNPARRRRRPPRTLWQQIRDRLLLEKGLQFATLAELFDDVAATGWDPHLLLAVALYTVTTQMDSRERYLTLIAFFDWAKYIDAKDATHRPGGHEQLPAAEREGLDPDLRAFIAKLFGPESDRKAA